MLIPCLTTPCFTTDIFPVCSLTITEIASDCSVIPIAERCLSPMLAGMLLFLLTGRIQRAAWILLSLMITAPSCKGVFLKNIVSNS